MAPSTVNEAIDQLLESKGLTVPADLELSSTSINENSPVNSVIGTLNTLDSNANDTFIYRLVEGNGVPDNDTFSIVNDQLLINNSPDFETQDHYNIRVQTMDQDGLIWEKELTITVNDLNEIPAVLTVSNLLTEISEDTQTPEGLKVADLGVEDDGLGINNLFLTGRDKDRFLIRDLALYYVGGTLNFEAQNSYEVTINVDDPTVGVTPDLAQSFTLKIIDVNEASTAVILTNTTQAIAENTDTQKGIKVADIQITDDALGTNSLSLVAYFSFGSANPDGAEHLRDRGNNTFSFEDLPGNLPNISDNDFNDGILAFTFIG